MTNTHEDSFILNYSNSFEERIQIKALYELQVENN